MANRAPKTGLKKPPTKKTSSRGAAPERDGDEDIGDEADGVTFNPEKFLEHVDNVGALKSKGATIRGQIGAAVKSAEEDYGIHRGAASLMIKLKNMQEEQRVAFLKSFDDMRTALGWAAQGDLFTGANSPAEAATFAGRGNS